jgi:glycosyltransferase involved in cell wall biosynthesis
LRVLFLSPYVPYPVRHGGHNRTLGLIRALTGFAEVHVLAIGDPRATETTLAQRSLAALGAGLDVFPATGPGPGEADTQDPQRLPDAAAHFRSPSLAAALRARLQATPPDVVHFEELVMAQYEEAFARPSVIDRQKVEWQLYATLAGQDQTLAQSLESARFRNWERRLAGRIDVALVTGPGDAEQLANAYADIRIVPIIVDDELTPAEAPATHTEHVLLYGTLDYAPNADANAFFFEQIWPRLRGAEADLTVHVVGSGTAPASIPRAAPHVELKGYTARIRPVLCGPGVLVAPLRVGGGSRTKILEALACGMPVISTRVGVENLGLTPGEHFLAAETPEDFVHAVGRVRSESGLRGRLARAGAVWIDAHHRVAVIGDALRSAYEPLARQRNTPPERIAARPGGRVLLVGFGPGPDEPDARQLSFPGHRTAQFAAELERSGCELQVVRLDEESGRANPTGLVQEVQRVHDEWEPDVVVSAGGFHAARAVSYLRTDRPRWLDLPGDLAAEAQVRAARAGHDGPIAEFLHVLRQALCVGDHFSVVGPSQRLAVLGQLGIIGRLRGDGLGEETLSILPIRCLGPPSAPPLPPEGFRVLSSGSYNTWLDEATVADGVMAAMARRLDLSFVSTGGPVRDHAETVHSAFWSAIRESPFATRFQDLGRVPRQRALAALSETHVVLCISRHCLEAELGSRQRIVEGMAYGRPVILTEQGDIAQAVKRARAGILVPPGNPRALADALVRLSPPLLSELAANARALWENECRADTGLTALSDWVRSPVRSPPTPNRSSDAALEMLQRELNEIRSSLTFRALRRLDRLLGRSG